MIRLVSLLTGSVAGRMVVAAAGAGGLLQALPGFAAVFGAKSLSRPAGAGGPLAGQSTIRINESDMAHMNAFPADRKAWVLAQIMALDSSQKSVHMTKHHYEKALLKLREDGFALIDLQPLETAFTSVWYRESGFPLRLARENAAMLVWETLAVGDSTTVIQWRI